VKPLRGDEFVIAADGGYAHTQRLGLKPDIVLGDFDSLGFVPEGAQRYPVEKDDTDCMIAVRLALQNGCDEIVIYGGLDGPRMDHTIANLQTLLYLTRQGARGTLVGVKNIVTAVRNGALSFDAEAAGTVSVFCMGEAARGVSVRGMKYELEDGTLEPDMPLGVSNCFVGKAAAVEVKAGAVIVIYDTENGWRHL
jgi:thiamine pyrophosphokinase